MSRKILNGSSIRRFTKTSQPQICCWPKPEYGPLEVQRARMMNGVSVAAAKPAGAQMGACTIMFQAGSRFETDDQIGATHFLRACSSASGQCYSAYSKTRVLQQHGAYITCSSDRQSIAYTLRCPISVFSTIKYYLLDIVRGSYHQHEIDTRKPLIKLDLQRIHPEQLVMDLLQKACWGGPLSNSIFCVEERIDDMTAENLNNFTAENFKTDGCSVGSVGLPFEDVLMLAEKIELRRERPPPRCQAQSYPRGGFEYHDLDGDTDTYIAVAVPSCGSTDLPCLMKHSILAAACGTGNVERGQHVQDRIPQMPLGSLAGADLFTDIKAFNVSHMDLGMFGILVKTRSACAWDMSFKAANFLKNLHCLTPTQIEIGKQRLKLDICIHDDDCVKMSEGLALQNANCLQLDSANVSLAMLDMICPEEVSAVATSLSNKNHLMAVAVVGDVGAVPTDRELLAGGCAAR